MNNDNRDYSDNSQSHQIKVALLCQQLDNMNEKLTNIESKLERSYVSMDKLQSYIDRTDRLEKLIYGTIAVIGSAIILAVLKLVLL